MKKILLNKIREGQFDPSKTIQESINSLNKSYSRAKETIERMHSDDEVTFRESLDREFQYYGRTINSLREKEYIDEQTKMILLRKELVDIFKVDVWDDVLLNCEFDTLEEFYESYKLYVRNNYAESNI